MHFLGHIYAFIYLDAHCYFAYFLDTQAAYKIIPACLLTSMVSKANRILVFIFFVTSCDGFLPRMPQNQFAKVRLELCTRNYY